MGERGDSRFYEAAASAPNGARFAIVAARFNREVVEHLLEGALAGLARQGVPAEAVDVVRVPGAWELPHVCRRLAASGRYAAVIALGAVIRGETPHFDYVAGEAARGCSRAQLDTGVPVVFGVLTTETLEQALARAERARGDKGLDAALTALEMAALDAALDADGVGR